MQRDLGHGAHDHEPAASETPVAIRAAPCPTTEANARTAGTRADGVGGRTGTALLPAAASTGTRRRDTALRDGAGAVDWPIQPWRCPEGGFTVVGAAGYIGGSAVGGPPAGSSTGHPPNPIEAEWAGR
jgi:hypothetical protein